MVREIERSGVPNNLCPIAAFKFAAQNSKIGAVCFNNIIVANKRTAVDYNLCHGNRPVAININGIVVAFEDTAVDGNFLFRITVTDSEGSRCGTCTLNRTGLLR